MPSKHLVSSCGGGGEHVLCELLVHLISVICKQISSDFFFKKTIGKNKENTVETPILSWGPTKGPWYLNLS